MTKSIIAERRSHEAESITYDQQVKKFLGEFGIKDSFLISKDKHYEIMLNHFYWIDKETNQGYHIPDDIEGDKRELNESELGIYEHLYYDAITY